LYGALARLEARNLVEPDAEHAEAGDRHRTVRITPAGQDALRAELEQMARVARAGLRALGENPA
jgi:DNA-binding PadR family transcriptional regulator